MKKKIKDINWKKVFYILGMLTVVIGASFFMIVESAKYYMNFYPKGSWKSIYLAGLLEMFSLILVMVRVKRHWFYIWGSRIILFFVFIAIISAAGMQAINPTLESIADIKQETGLVDILKQELVDARTDRELFDRQKQRRNTAIAAAQRRKMVDELMNVMKKDAIANTGIIALLNILLLFGIRIVIQIANLFCANSMGVIYREHKKEKRKKTIKYTEPEDVSYKNAMMKEFPNAECLKRGEEYNVFIDNIKCGSGSVPLTAWKNAYKQKDKIKRLIEKKAQKKYEKEKEELEKAKKDKIKRIKFEKEKRKKERKNKTNKERQLIYIKRLKEYFRKKIKGEESVDVRNK